MQGNHSIFPELLKLYPRYRFEKAAGQTAPELTVTQTADYTKHKYLCYDILYIPGTGQLKRSNDIVINGHTVKMPDAPFRLLVELVAELKKGEGGWLTKHTETGKYQSIDRLRKPIG